MAEMAGGAFLTVVFQKLLEQLASPELRKNTVASKLKTLEEKLKKVRLLLDEAEDRQLFEEKVKEWLDELKHVVFMADDLVEEINGSKEDRKSKRKAVTRAIKTVYHSLTKTVQGEIDLILTDLDSLLDRALVLDLKHSNSTALNNTRASPRFIAPLREEHHVFGREAEKEEILEMLLAEEDKIGVIPIVGMGGLGKTTLAQLVFDDDRVNNTVFELRAWATVSTEFDFCRIIKELLQKVNPGTSTSDVNDPNGLQRLMKEAVRGKRFLFVLDDVWDQNYDNWDLLMSNFAAGDRRSRVIVTTRSRDVGSMVKTGPIHELKEVGDDDCWRIFVHHAFNGDEDSDPDLQAIGRRIVEKCKGLPLAVKSMGGLLRSERNPEKWESILKSHAWSESQGNRVLPSLWLSYRYLPSSLKQCFAFCSVFPQDYEFDKEKIVLLWMAEGFLPSDEEENRTEEVGERYFDDMISRSLFQRSSQDQSKFVMHDLVHDLAVFVSGESCFRHGYDSVNLNHLTSRTRHFSCPNVSADLDLLTNLSRAKHLSTFLALNSSLNCLELQWSDDFVEELVTKLRCLRVLSLVIRSPVAHCSLGNLKHLRYLDLSGSDIEELPDSICSLFHLQTLILSNCYKICLLPTDIGKLIKLRHLDTYGTRLTKMPPNMGNLKELRKLTNFVLGEAGDNSCSGLEELGELQHLRGTLRISKLQNVESVDNVRKANLRDKAEIRELILKWGHTVIKSNTREVDVLDALRPHANLQKLVVYWYSSSSFPIWISEASFSKMVYVELRGTSSFRGSLPPLGQLLSLRELIVGGFRSMEKIGYEFYGGNNSSNIVPFQCLESLEFWDMRSLEEWSFLGRDGTGFGCFPRLKYLILTRCPDLGTESLLDCETLETLEIWDSFFSMECFPLDKYPNLKSLRLSSVPNLKSLTSGTEEDKFLPSLTSLSIMSCQEMESFPEKGLPLSLNSLDIVNCNKLVAQNRHWNLQKLVSLISLSLWGCDSPLDLFPDVSLPASLTYFALHKFQNLKSLNGSAFQNVESLGKLSIRYCDKLETLPEQVLVPGSLCSLEILYCRSLEKWYWKFKEDYLLTISHIPQISVSGPTTDDLEREERDRRQSETSTNA